MTSSKLKLKAYLKAQSSQLKAQRLPHSSKLTAYAAGESPVSNLSGGEVRRVALTRLLLERPDVILLDEPTNHLDADSVAWLEHFLAGDFCSICFCLNRANPF